MAKHFEKFFLFVTDFATINITFLVWAWLRKNMGYFAETELRQLFVNSLFVFFFWLLLFIFYGLYRSWHAQSRVDEFLSVCKVVSIGVVLIFLVTIEPRQDVMNPLPTSRALLASYWLLMIVLVSAGRLALRTFQRALLEAGIGVRKALIVGWGVKAQGLFDQIRKLPALGYDVIGFIDDHNPPVAEVYKACPVLGSLSEIKQVVNREKVEEILIALEGESQTRVTEILAQCSGLAVNCKTVPAFLDVITGQTRTNQIYGFPLIEVMPEPMSAWEQRIKRGLDIVVALFVLVVFFPLWLLVTLAIRLNSRGPVFYAQQRVGKGGKFFTQYQFRTPALDHDGCTKSNLPLICRIIHRLRFHNVPLFVNVLIGDMSLIGPRPERPHIVEILKQEIPLYARRLKIQPGLTGWAQIKGDCDASLEEAQNMLPYDFFYIENMSLRIDLKILLMTIYLLLIGKRAQMN